LFLFSSHQLLYRRRYYLYIILSELTDSVNHGPCWEVYLVRCILFIQFLLINFWDLNELTFALTWHIILTSYTLVNKHSPENFQTNL
jgi:hypothetical protein